MRPQSAVPAGGGLADIESIDGVDDPITVCIEGPKVETGSIEILQRLSQEFLRSVVAFGSTLPGVVVIRLLMLRRIVEVGDKVRVGQPPIGDIVEVVPDRSVISVVIVTDFIAESLNFGGRINTRFVREVDQDANPADVPGTGSGRDSRLRARTRLAVIGLFLNPRPVLAKLVGVLGPGGGGLGRRRFGVDAYVTLQRAVFPTPALDSQSRGDELGAVGRELRVSDHARFRIAYERIPVQGFDDLVEFITPDLRFD